MADRSEYGRWTKEALIKRIKYLETEIRAGDFQNPKPVEATTTADGAAAAAVTTPSPGPGGFRDGGRGAGKGLKSPRKRPTDRKFDPTRYSTRLVALKLAYVGKNYGGFEFQASANLPTIEEELWKALVKSCLIFPENPDEVRFDDWQYSKCGRTDRGVSAFGQVIAIRLRSNRPKAPEKEKKEEKTAQEAGVVDDVNKDGGAEMQAEMGVQEDIDLSASEEKVEKGFDDFTDEIQYCRVLNRLLPKDIRVLAWCPTTPEGFSARHHCRERQYRYFFTQPAYPPIPSSLEDPRAHAAATNTRADKPKDGWLDIAAMRAAAKKFEGLHDFRNFCKVDASKQITNFDRRIFESDVVEVEDVATALPFLDGDEFRPPNSTAVAGEDPPRGKFPKVYYFHVRGSAFLWHQIRCMVAVLFMVAQGLEEPAVVDRLLDPAAQPCRPNYVLANETPLVLWDCIFPQLEGENDDVSERKPPRDPGERHADAMRWVYLGEENPLDKHSPHGLVEDLWEYWRERKLDELLAGQVLGLVAAQSDIGRRLDRRAPLHVAASQRVFEGGNRAHMVGRYQPMAGKATLPAPDEVYDREARRKGFRDALEWREATARKRAEALADIMDADE
ncbi:hypothetical protein DL764_009628 [Monosporascus ibericus]|uniref:Pseudouridine synthase I TruA alpha/beta domain-containing protein n=1 Tax=Monosporascus ibericus TaxID=155417 RepID=A0A4Q4SXA0_9PEZI|nr:hypothetical protein DL764_009628 [Monosporascus ibericus]